MAHLTKNRITDELASGGTTFVDPVAGGAEIFAGAMVALNGTGNALRATPTAATMRGVAVEHVDNSGGANGDWSITVKRGVFLFNQTGLTRADIGDDVFVVDDNTVGSAGTLIAGKLVQIETRGAWVEIS